MDCDYLYFEFLKVCEGRDDNKCNVDLVCRLLFDYWDVSGLYNIGVGNRGVIVFLFVVVFDKLIVFVGYELMFYIC